MGNSREMPKYKCHKVVWALQIKEVICHAHEDTDISIEEFAKSDEFKGGHIIPVEEGYGPVPFDAGYYRKHNPVAGGYYVVYKGGYKSFSPAQALENGYTKIGSSPPISIDPDHACSLKALVKFFAEFVKTGNMPETEIRSDKLTTAYCDELIEALNV